MAAAERQQRALRQLQPSAITFRQILRRRLALIPWVERDEHRRGVALVGAGDDVEAGHDEHVLDRRMAEQNPLYGRPGIGRALQRRGIGQCQRAEDITLIFRRHEAARHRSEQQKSAPRMATNMITAITA